jgi:hypothetical protein
VLKGVCLNSNTVTIHLVRYVPAKGPHTWPPLLTGTYKTRPCKVTS